MIVKYEVPVRCTCGDKKILFYVIIDEEKKEIILAYKAGDAVAGTVSLTEATLQLLKGRVYFKE